MLPPILVALSLFCAVSGITLLVFPRGFLAAARVMDKEYCTEKVRELLEREIATDKLREMLDTSVDLNARFIRFYRLTGLVSIVVGVSLLIVVFVHL